MTKIYEDKMDQAVKHLEGEFRRVRAGRANPGVLDRVTVEYYGVPTPVAQVASVSTADARTLVITPWDRSILKEINNNEKMWSTFYSWEEERQEEFLDFCTGARGVKVMYDFVSKEVLNPESTPERIDELLSLLLKQEVHVMEVLPNDGTRLADESSLVIMDIVVQLSDGSIANLEIQKIGYKFQGERSACYSAD